MSKEISLKNQSLLEIIKVVKSEARQLQRIDTTKKRKQSLNIVARKYGFDHYDDLQGRFQSEAKMYRERYRSHCLSRLHDPEKNYYFVTMHSDFQYSYFSHWVGWSSDGYELREPSHVNADIIERTFRDNDKELYVIHQKEEFHRWTLFWLGRALVEESVIVNGIRSFLEPSISYERPEVDLIENS